MTTSFWFTFDWSNAQSLSTAVINAADMSHSHKVALFALASRITSASMRRKATFVTPDSEVL